MHIWRQSSFKIITADKLKHLYSSICHPRHRTIIWLFSDYFLMFFGLLSEYFRTIFPLFSKKISNNFSTIFKLFYPTVGQSPTKTCSYSSAWPKLFPPKRNFRQKRHFPLPPVSFAIQWIYRSHFVVVLHLRWWSSVPPDNSNKVGWIWKRQGW